MKKEKGKRKGFPSLKKGSLEFLILNYPLTTVSKSYLPDSLAFSLLVIVYKNSQGILDQYLFLETLAIFSEFLYSVFEGYQSWIQPKKNVFPFKMPEFII